MRQLNPPVAPANPSSISSGRRKNMHTFGFTSTASNVNPTMLSSRPLPASLTSLNLHEQYSIDMSVASSKPSRRPDHQCEDEENTENKTHPRFFNRQTSLRPRSPPSPTAQPSPDAPHVKNNKKRKTHKVRSKLHGIPTLVQVLQPPMHSS
ncbi:MAG: hypothetical protein Q9175_003888 [Cornicularia normoerica]